MNQAIGMIETKGLLAMIEATDTMLKSSEVQLLGKSKVGGGLNTVMITGDVAAVETAVQAGIAGVERLGAGLLAGYHVIPRPEVTAEMFVEQAATPVTEEAEVVEVVEESTEPTEVLLEEPVEELAEVVSEAEEQDPREKMMQELMEMKVVELRKLAKEQTNFSIPNKEIYHTSKEKLVAALVDFLITNE